MINDDSAHHTAHENPIDSFPLSPAEHGEGRYERDPAEYTGSFTSCFVYRSRILGTRQ